MQSKATTLMIMLLIACSLAAQTRNSILEQRLTLKIDNQSVEQVLKDLEEKGGFSIAYSSMDLDTKRRVSLNLNNATISEILDQLFQGQSISYRDNGQKLLLYTSKSRKVSGAVYQTVRGTIIDSDTQQPIPGANILVPGSDPLIGASTDAYGRFKMERVPVGRHTFQATFIGYLPKVMSNVTVDAGKEVVLSIGLEESVTQLQSVEVVAEIDKSRPLNEMALISAKSFTVEETSRYAGSFNDPARMATTYAGVVGSADDTENSIIIRGNSPRGLLWRLEGLEVPNPNHFASDGASNGAISMLNSNVMANSDFLTGAFPAEYGNAFSGVFDLKLRNGNNEKREYAIQAGLLGIDASLEGPIRRKPGKNLPNASYLVNYRYSTISILESMGLQIAGEGQVVPAFQDLAFKVNVPTANAGTFSWYGLGGKSDGAEPNERTENGQTFQLDESEEYKLGLTGLSHIINLGKNSYLESAMSYAVYQYDYLYENLFNSQVFVQDIEDYRNTNFRVASTLNTKFNARHTTKFGLIYTDFGYNLQSSGRSDEAELLYFANEKGNFGMYQAFVSHKMDITDDLTLTGGVHYIRLGLANQDNIEPRFGLRWQFKSDQSFSFGFGLHSRKEETSLYFTELAFQGGAAIQPNLDLELAKARHFVVGYDRTFGRDFHLKLEAYYQGLYDIPISADPNSGFSSLNQEDAFQRLPLVNEGKGENYGVELTFEKFFSKGYFFLLTGSLYNSTYQTITGEKFNTRYNGNYNSNLVAGKEFSVGDPSKNKTLNIGFEAVFNGGAREREIDLEASIREGTTIYVPNSFFEKRLKDYARFDFQISLKSNRRKVTHELKLDIQNLTSRQNVIDRSFVVDLNQIKNASFTGELIPVLSYKIIF